MIKDYKKAAIWVGLGFVALGSLYIIIILLFWTANQNKIYPGVSVSGIDLSGKTQADAEQILKAEEEKYLAGKINFSSEKSKLYSLSDFAISFDNKKSAIKALKYGRVNPFALGFKKDFMLDCTYSSDALFDKINSASAETSTPVIDSSVIIQNQNPVFQRGTVGKRINFAETASKFNEAISNLENTFAVSEFKIDPIFNQSDFDSKTEQIKSKIQNPITLSGAGQGFTISQSDLASFISLGGDNKKLSINFGDDGFLLPVSGYVASDSIFSTAKIEAYLSQIAPKINYEPINAQLSITDGRATVFVPSKNGQTLNMAKTIENILIAIDEGKAEASLVVDVKKPEVSEGSLNDLGINELISTGYSNFYGSPTNRKQNIRVGASKFNGVLIKPDQVFSFNENLGPVDAEHGYLPELVILEDKTTPEYGGGMCQVSSTAFRAALNAGLPILERTPHAYPVTYYKPYGVDATVYLPKPDMVFKNDTGHYILIQTHIEGYKLTFDFYGTKPKRTVSFAGNENASGAVSVVEQVNPYIYDQEVRGRASFTAQFWRFIYDESGNLLTRSSWVSKYESPDKYPH